MKILLVSATSFEIAPFIDYLEKEYTKKSFFEFEKNGLSIYILVTGIGALNTSFGMARLKGIEKFDLAINLGLAGDYSLDTPLGTVVEVYKDRFGDLGVEENDASFTDIYELELANPNQFPYADGYIVNQHKYETKLEKKHAITVNKVHGTRVSIDRIVKKYNPNIESMEGAGFMYACKIIDLEAIQFRAISNHVIPRDKNKWEIALAIKNLNVYIKGFIESLNNHNK